MCDNKVGVMFSLIRISKTPDERVHSRIQEFSSGAGGGGGGWGWGGGPGQSDKKSSDVFFLVLGLF